MGVISDLVAAPADAAQEICGSASPAESWEGFSYKDLDNVTLATLLSLVSSASPDDHYEKWLAAIPTVAQAREEGPWVFVFSDEATNLLAVIDSKEPDEFNDLVESWAATEELQGWRREDVRDVLRSIGRIAQTAAEEDKKLFLWLSL